MRYLNLSIILSLLSFNSYGTPNQNNVHLKASLDLTESRDSWIKTAKQAGLNNQEPDHLLEILELEKRLFAELLKHKESTIGNDPVKWKKHALASLLSYYAAKNVVRVVGECTAGTAIKTATKIAARIVAYYYAFRTAYRTPVNAAAEATALDVSSTAARTAVLDVFRTAALGASRTTAYHDVCYCCFDIALDAAIRNPSRAAALDAVKDLSHHKKIVRVAYRVAETQAWITVLDSSLTTFEKAYDNIYSRLNDLSEEDLGEWFRSQEAFENKLNKYFVNREGLSDRSKEFLEHIKNHLTRMIPKMFPSNEV